VGTGKFIYLSVWIYKSLTFLSSSFFFSSRAHVHSRDTISKNFTNNNNNVKRDFKSKYCAVRFSSSLLDSSSITLVFIKKEERFSDSKFSSLKDTVAFEAALFRHARATNIIANMLVTTTSLLSNFTESSLNEKKKRFGGSLSRRSER
jgi:hypothetical protein